MWAEIWKAIAHFTLTARIHEHKNVLIKQVTETGNKLNGAFKLHYNESNMNLSILGSLSTVPALDPQLLQGPDLSAPRRLD